jgi:CRP-like cAMP-binding protein
MLETRAGHSETLAEDPLTYLPRKTAHEVPKGTTIYGPDSPNRHLHVVIAGRVRISRASVDGGHTVGRFVRADGLFGETALSGRPEGLESAVAMDDVTLMSWSRDEVERQIEREPKLGLALCQSLVRQALELEDRIESMAVYKTPERVIQALLQLANDLGSEMPDGAVRIASLTHHTLAEYVGTSREIVTFQMNRLRRLGLIRYSRQFIDVNPEPLREALRGSARAGAD